MKKRRARNIVLNAFTPAMEVLEPSRFAGRKPLIERLTDSLHIQRQCPVIFGDRGLGKTSLATQAARIALGDTALLAEHGLEERGFDHEDRYAVFMVNCSDGVASCDALIERLINTAQGFLEAENLTGTGPTRTTTTSGLHLKVFEATVEKQYEKATRRSFGLLSPEERLIAIAEHVTQHTGRQVLFVIDELDRVRNLSGFASFLKSTVSDHIKFMLVGVGANVAELIRDHNSAIRLLRPIEVQRMSPAELNQIIDKVNNHLALNELAISFSENARKALTEAAAGFPWFIHLLGQASLSLAYDRGEHLVHENSVRQAMDGLALNEFATQYNDLYLKAIGDSQPREIVMRLFAKWNAEEVPTSEIYPLAKALKVGNPSQCVRDLQHHSYGGVLERARAREYEGGLYVFRSSMFKRFVSLRHAEYDGVQESVDVQWSKHHGY